MKHKVLVVVAVAVGLYVVAKTTVLGSYAGTLWSQVKSSAKSQVSTKFELERARHEIKSLDKDISAAIRPIAEYKAALQQLDKEVQKTQANIAERRETLLRLARELEGHPTTVFVSNRAVPYEKAKAALERDFEGFQRLEKNAESLTKLQAAKQQSLDAAQEQLAKIIAKKREFELRVAQLETDEETLQIASVGNKMAVDDNRSSAIEAALGEIEQRHNVRRAELELAAGDLVSEALAPRKTPALDVGAVRSYLEKAGKE